MGFQDNSGDIIFDVVLTDEGRRRLANPSEPFEIKKFALGDDEINYGSFVKLTASAYQDLEILQTPIFEAFTNNTSNMSSMLTTYTNNNLLYLPIIKLNELNATQKRHGTLNSFIITCNEETANNANASITTGVGYDANGARDGFIFGHDIQAGGHIRIDAGLDTTALPPSPPLSGEMREMSYSIEIDNRLGKICSLNGSVDLSPVSVDDDDIALYVVGGSEPFAFSLNPNTSVSAGSETVSGPRSSILRFAIKPTVNLRDSNFLFTRLGGEAIMANETTTPGSENVRYIDTLVKIAGLDSGYSIDIPVRFVKLK
jgi:hypothetical protein